MNSTAEKVWCDEFLGDWKLVKKTKDSLTYERTKEAKLTPAFAQVYYENNQRYLVHGPVTLVQRRILNIPTGRDSLHKEVVLGPGATKTRDYPVV